MRPVEGGSTGNAKESGVDRDGGRASDAALEEYRTAIRDTTRLSRLLAILSEPAPIGVVVDRVVIALSEMFAADVVALLQPAGDGELTTIGAIGLPEDLGMRRFNGEAGSCPAAAIESRAPVLVEHAMDEPGMDPILTELEIQTAAWLPVLGSREVLGVLVVGRGQPLELSRSDTDLMMTMLYRMGLVLERARAEEERVYLESRLRQAEKAESLGRMAAAIAHQLNNKLTAVMGFLELAHTEIAAGRDPSTDVEDAQEAARDASRVGLQMLTYLGQGLRGREPFDLVAACREWIPQLADRLRQDVRIRLELPEHALVIMGSPADIHELLAHLVTNADESMEGGGEIAISVREAAPAEIELSPLVQSTWARPEGRYACLEVSDSGSGMDSEVLRNAFDPFFTTKFTGRGLGLAVVLGVVRAHDGTLTASSVPGAGSSFSALFPLARE